MKEPLVCRHGVALCYRCGVGPNVNEQKVARLAKMDQAVVHLSPNFPAPRTPPKDDVLPKKQSKPKKRRIIPCVHRGEYVGTLDCACDGARDVYRCTKLDRPGNPGEKAFCMAVLTSKAYSRIVDPETKRVLHRVRNGEVILCRELHSIENLGELQMIGCESYKSGN